MLGIYTTRSAAADRAVGFPAFQFFFSEVSYISTNKTFRTTINNQNNSYAVKEEGRDITTCYIKIIIR